MTFIEQVQTSLNAKGFKCGEVDGIMGPKTEKAIIAFKHSIGFRARVYLGPKTLARLGINTKMGLIPWLNEVSKWLGTHEEDPKLKAYLASDGIGAIDPDDTPWCAALIQQALHDSMPNEFMPKRAQINPLLAYNYLELGNKCEPLYGAIVILWRKNENSIYGHIAILIGYDPILKRYRIRGGNQSDMVCDAWIDAHRVRKHGFRVPNTFTGTLPPLPIMDSSGAVISTNEA